MTLLLLIAVVIVAIIQLYTLYVMDQQHECFHMTMEHYASEQKKGAAPAENRSGGVHHRAN